MTIDNYLAKSQELITHANALSDSNPEKSRRLINIVLEEHTKLLDRITRRTKDRGQLAEQLRQCSTVFNQSQKKMENSRQ